VGILRSIDGVESLILLFHPSEILLIGLKRSINPKGKIQIMDAMTYKYLEDFQKKRPSYDGNQNLFSLVHIGAHKDVYITYHARWLISMLSLVRGSLIWQDAYDKTTFGKPSPALVRQTPVVKSRT
jgi:hypothetical protein